MKKPGHETEPIEKKSAHREGRIKKTATKGKKVQERKGTRL